MDMDERTYAKRWGRLRRILNRRGIRDFLTTSLTNVRYLCGFTGSNGALLFTPDEVVFFSDGRYTEQAKTEVKGCRIVIAEQGPFAAGIAQTIRESKLQRLAFESQSMTVLFHQRLHRHLRGKVRFLPSEGLVGLIRMVKDKDEVRAIRKAARVADRAFRVMLGRLSVGMTEREAQWHLLTILHELGSERSPFEPIVLFGSRASLPHGKPGGNRLARGNWILMDYGATVDGYCSDFTRTVVKGSATPEMRRIYNVVRRGQEAAVRAARPRVAARTVDAAARKVIEKAGFGKEFSHGLGHGVGLEVHENPRLARRSKETLRSGITVTIEPGIYIPGWGGIRIEDTILITPKGSKRLTRSTRALIEI
jgi:Xaa-Pro aminopeptidase